MAAARRRGTIRETLASRNALQRRGLLHNGIYFMFEVVFTASALRRGDVEQLARELGLPLSCVGNVTDETATGGKSRLEIVDALGRALPAAGGYDHFS